MEFKSKLKEDLRNISIDELIKEFRRLKNELLYMEDSVNNKFISYEQKSEFLNTDIPNTKENLDLIEEEIIIPMNENLSLGYINYEVENRSDLRIVSTHSRYYKLFYDENTNDLYNDYIYEDRYKEFKNIINDLNNKKIIDYRTDYITIYTSQENINKLLSNNGY